MVRPGSTVTRRLLGRLQTLLAVAVLASFGWTLYIVTSTQGEPPDGSASPMVAEASPTSTSPMRTPPVGSPGAAVAASAAASASATPRDLPTDAPASVEPAAEPTEASTPQPTPKPTVKPTAKPAAEPTAKPTAKPTPKPTAKPQPDPAPEGTPKITTAKGSFGQTLTVKGITVTMSRREPAGLARCAAEDDPEMQGWTDEVSYDLTMTWPDPTDADEPWIAVGNTPYNVLWFDGAGRFSSGAQYVFSTCHKPGDSFKAMVEISPPGSPIIYYRWYFS